MEEVREQLLPALALATKFITNDRAQAWFSHVKYAPKVTYTRGLTVLQYSPYSRTGDAIASVGEQLTALASTIKFTWVSPESSTAKGSATSSVLQAYRYMFSFIHADKAQFAEVRKHLDTENGSDDQFDPSIWTNLRHFNLATMRRHNPGYYVRSKLCTDLDLARTPVHELAHVWTEHCHSNVRESDDPLIMREDMIPEASQCWEQFMFGVSLELPNLVDDQPFYILSHSFSDSKLFPYTIPEPSWVEQWYRKDTWTRFSELHKAEKLKATTPDDNI
jgi:hypothetical protein